MSQQNKEVTKKFGEPSDVTSQTPGLKRDDWLEGMAVAFRDNTLVLDQLLPDLAVKKDEAKYRVYLAKGYFKAAGKRGETALPEQSALQYSNDTYSCDDYALEGWVSDAAIQNAADDISPLADETEYLSQKVKLSGEILAATEIFTAIKAAGTSHYSLLTNATKWLGGASANILGDVSSAIKAITKSIGRRPNVMTLNTDSLEALINNSTILDLLKYTKGNLIESANPINAMRGLRLLMADAVVNTGTEETPVYSNILYDVDTVTAFKQSVVIAYVEAANKLTLGKTFVSQPFQVFTGRGLEGDRRKSTLVYVSKKFTPKVQNVNAAYVIANVLGA
jgi:hypothetical protein